MESLLNLKSLLEYKETVSIYAAEYQKLGWVLQAMPPRDGSDLQVDFGADPAAWGSRLWEPGLSEPKINLGVRTGEPSRLMVLEIAQGPGKSILDQYGPWQAGCIAALGADRERHFYAWDPSLRFDPGACRQILEIRWFGAGQVVPVPPSGDPGRDETWRWLSPPWEKPPRYPGESLLRFMQEHCCPKPRSGESFPDNVLLPAGQTSVGLSGQPAAKPGPSGFLRRLGAEPPKTRPLRIPLSCRKTGGGFGEV